MRVMSQPGRSACLVALALKVLVAFGSGCSTAPPTPVVLQYQVAERERAVVQLSGMRIGVSPFHDGRSDPYLYRKSLILADGQDAGIWVANALRVELEHAGAEVEALPAGVAPTSGRAITGQVAFLKAQASGWHLGGILAAMIGTGYMPQITLTVQLYEEGVPVLSRQYDLKKNVPSNIGHVLMWGFPPADKDVPIAFGVVLKKMLREQVLPEIARELNDGVPRDVIASQ